MLLLLFACDEEVPKEDTAPIEIDVDEDGWLAEEDCDDADPGVNPDAPEICDGVDQDCDTLVDEDTTETRYEDLDGDGWGGAAFDGCADDGVDDDGDCDDTNALVNPDADESCNYADDDCDALIDEGVATEYWSDADGDGWGDPDTSVDLCEPAEGYVENRGDCDDTTAAASLSEDESCDGIDNDCDGTVDDGVTTTSYTDADLDGYGDSNQAYEGCDVPAGNVLEGGDCDDADTAVGPGTLETCNGIDDDCDLEVDEDDASDASTWYVDNDADGWGGVATTACSQPEGSVTVGGDCDDGDAGATPDGPETCDGTDDDCDGTVDEDDAVDATTWYEDADGDRYGVASLTACTRPVGYTPDGEDCDDADASVNPGASETCDGIDNDCDTRTDEGVRTTWYADADADGYGDPTDTSSACEAPAGYIADAGDCDDADAAVYPSASEVCDGADSDCDGDRPAEETDDSDGDGTVDCADAVYGSALSFDGDDLVTIPGSSSLTSLGTPFTVEAWFSTTTALTGETAFLGKHLCGDDNGWFLGLDAGAASWFYGADPALDGATSLVDGAWHHVAGTYDGSTMVLYVDGVAVTSQSMAFVEDNTENLTIGVPSDDSSCSTHFEGTLDELSVWSVARTDAEVAADAAARLTGLESGLEALWSFDDLAGQTLGDEGPNGWDGLLGRSAAVEGADPTWVEDGPF